MTQANQDQQEEFQQFLEVISPTLRMKIQMEIFMEAIKKNELLKLIEHKHQVAQINNQVLTKSKD